MLLQRRISLFCFIVLSIFTVKVFSEEEEEFKKAKKAGTDETLAKYDGKWSVGVPESSAIEADYGLILESKARHHAISAKLNRPLRFDTKEVVIQYEVKFQNGMECGGAYVKLLSSHADHDLLHFIFRHKNPVSSEYEEKFIKSPKKDLNDIYDKKTSHLFTLVLRDDNSFETYIDQVLANSGSLLSDFEPPVNPKEEIDDPKDQKPADWDDNRKIPDPSASKPDDWDEDAPELIVDEAAVKPIGWLDSEPSMINDPNAKKPDDWDSEIDGEWEPPQMENPTCKDAPGCGEWKAPKIKNPAHKGKWSAPLIDNPNYKGEWVPRKIKNPNYFQDHNPFKMTEVFAVGLELWSMSDGVVFDNFLIVDSKEAADKFASETWIVKKEAEKRADPSAKSVVEYVRESINEKPLVVAGVAFCIIVPLVLLCYCLLKPSKSGERMEADAAHKKDDDRYTAAGPVYSDDRSPLVQDKSPASKSPAESDNEAEKSDDPESPVTKSEADSDAPNDKPEEKVRRRKVRKD